MDTLASAEAQWATPELQWGTTTPFHFDPSAIEWQYDPAAPDQEPPLITLNDVEADSPYLGLRRHGWYPAADVDGSITDYHVVSGLYHKWDPATGRLEQQERLMIVRGEAFGGHKDHFHQDPGTFLVAADIGRYDPTAAGVDRLALFAAQADTAIAPKYFSSECFDRRQVTTAAEPTIANPWANPDLKAHLRNPDQTAGAIACLALIKTALI